MALNESPEVPGDLGEDEFISDKWKKKKTGEALKF